MEVQGHAVGVCSWSLQPQSYEDLAQKVGALGLSHIQLAHMPLLDASQADRDRAVGVLRDAGIEVTAAMAGFPGEDYSTIATIARTGGLTPDETWPQRRDLTLRAATLAAALGMKAMSMHIGFIPPSNDQSYPTIVQRLNELIANMTELGVDLLMETGQEPASDLLQLLNNLRRNVGVNFDPANMLLYGSGDPLEAIQVLGSRIRHVHVKDAVRSDNPGTDWGDEVPFGNGEVPHSMFLAALRQAGYRGPLVIERESGDDRLGDIAYAIETLAAL